MTEYWNIPSLWRGDVFVYGGGTSLMDFPNDKLRDKRVVGCNDAYILGADVIDMICFGDKGFYLAHKDCFHNYDGLIVTNCNKSEVRSSSQVKICKRLFGAMSGEPYKLGWYANTGCMAVELAIKLGGERIFLLGFDCRMSNDKKNSNWYDPVRKTGRTPRRFQKSIYEKFVKWFARFEKDRRITYPNVEIVNLNPDSALDVYPKKEWRDVL